jgi:hypothetical protein
MSLREELRLRYAAAAKDFDAARLPQYLTEPLRIRLSLKSMSLGKSISLDPQRTSLICNIGLGIALTFLLFVSIRQNQTIRDQRQNIYEMSQNPYCLGAPGFRGKPSVSPLVPSGPVIQNN